MLAEVEALKALLEASIASLRQIMRENSVSRDRLDKVRFSRIDSRFATNERIRLEQKTDTRQRINYAIDSLRERADEHFRANQQAIISSKQANSTLTDKLSDAVDTKTDALSSKIDDLKERVGTIESAGRGAAAQRTEGRAHLSSTTAVIGTAIALVGILLALLVGRNSAKTNNEPVITPTITLTVPNPTP